MICALALVPLGRFEEEIIVALGIERRVKVDQVNGFGCDALAQDIQVITEVELVHAREFYLLKTAAAILNRTGKYKRLLPIGEAASWLTGEPGRYITSFAGGIVHVPSMIEGGVSFGQ